MDVTLRNSIILLFKEPKEQPIAAKYMFVLQEKKSASI